MKIARIRLFQVDYPLVEGRYSWADGKFVEVFDSTIVEIETDDGLTGVGEICPLGPFYLPAFAAGARAGMAELAPHLIGLEPTALGIINDVMDRALLGHPYVKSAIDMACWDLLGKRSGLSVCDLMGGRQGESIALYRAITQLPPDEMAENLASYKAQGYKKFQLKVGGKPQDDIARIKACAGKLESSDVMVADANTGCSPMRRCKLSPPSAIFRFSLSSLAGPIPNASAFGVRPAFPLSWMRISTVCRR
ncbi:MULTISPECIES: hypothetical protein [Rhizobium/Agrobacterium group]|uniref:hypothetical protein n=1 Tax=Rhizobium/Agrobacterium group TaxID=227290 RepID=UPI001F2A85F8